MNLLNYKEQRTRIKKPVFIVIISIILVLSPVYNYYLQLTVRNLSMNWKNIQSIYFTGFELAFLILPIICGIGLYLIKKWAWYLFMLYSIILILFNIYASIVNPVKFNFYSLLESTIIFMGTVYILKKDISAPYFKMYPRGWRGEKRKPIQIKVLINAVERFTKDISEAGFYVNWKDVPFEINQEVIVEIETKQGKQVFTAGVVRKDENGVGFAFRQLGNEKNKQIQDLIQAFSV